MKYTKNDDKPPSASASGPGGSGPWGRALVTLLASLFIGACGAQTGADDSNAAIGNTAQKAELAVSPGSGSSSNPSAPTSGRTVWVVMKQRANVVAASRVGGWNARGQAVYQTLYQNADTSQQALKSWLTQRGVNFKSFWAVNTLKVTADETLISQIAQRADVDRIEEDHTLEIPVPEPGTAVNAIDAIEWNISEVRAPEAWEEFGTRGEGVVVGTIDTGAQFDHPALFNKYRGLQEDGTVVHDYNWYDPSNVCGFPAAVPCDNAGHGTHTMGTILGDDGGENQIGVAPGAHWIAAKGCEDYSCSTEALLSAGQWMLAPTDLSGNNPRPELRPQIVSNSWGGWGGDDFYMEIVDAWIAAGMFPVFSNGNDGDGCFSSGSPGDYPQSYSAGAYDQFGEIAWFSSRGESAYGVTKPNLSAPGVDVRSSVPGGYDWYSGTSMAAPHIAGAVALLWSAAPAIWGDVDGTRLLLDTSAVDVSDLSCGGSDENNNVWGEGKLDVFEALALAPIGPTGYLVGSVVDAAQQPITGALVSVSGAANRKTLTSDAGEYSLRLPVGEYAVTASAFGYLPQTADGLPVVEDERTEQAFALDVAPTHVLDGRVADAAGQPVVGASVQLLATPLRPTVTDENGYFTFGDVPQGTYTLSTRAGGCYQPQLTEIELLAPLSVEVGMSNVVDAYGYECRPVSFDYIDGETPLGLYGDYSMVGVALPFDFTFYGVTYDLVKVDAGGYLAFLADYPNPWNVGIPDLYQPNAAIYGLWDQLYLDGSDQVLTAVVGEAPHRSFVVEWRDVPFVEDFSQRVSFEIVLHESGEIVVQYKDAETHLAKGGSATVGIENESGNVALQYSYNREELRSGLAVAYEVPFSGFVKGSVTDQNDSGTITGARVTATHVESGIARTASTNAKGAYRLQLTQGTYELTVTKANYETKTALVVVTEDETEVQDFVLRSALAVVEPATIQLLLPTDSQRTRTFTLENRGSVPMNFALREAGGRRQTTIATAQLQRAEGIDLNAKDTRRLYVQEATRPNTVTPLAVGDVLQSFAPQGVSAAWGIGQADRLWISDLNSARNVEFELDGTPTGVLHDTPWSGEWPADMAFDTTHGLVCQTAVGADNGIYCWDQESGEVAAQLSGPWSSISQRGLAYSPTDDTFFVGGWNEGTIYHLQGLDGAAPGEVISSCRPADGDISGLAYNSAMGVLWVATNSYTDTIYELNPDDCTVLSTMRPPQSGGYQGAGLEMDLEGNLWAVAQYPSTVYLLESGVPAFGDISWISAAPAEGTVAVGDKIEIAVSIDTSGMEPGLYLGSLFVVTNSGRQPNLRVPVSLVVSGYVQGVNAAGSPYVDSLGDLWDVGQRHRAGSWGYVQRGQRRASFHGIADTEDPVLYQSQHENPYAYRYDDVPNGVYEVELRFAELTNARIGRRLFDVIVENSLVLPAHDIAYEVGRYAADDYRFFVEVTDNRMDVRFVPRSGSLLPVVNALRIAHRPDR